MIIHKRLYSSTVGSRLHGTATRMSDHDRRVIFRHSLDDMLTPLDKPSETYEDSYTDTTYFELSHFTRMLAKANPTAIEIVWGIDNEGDWPLMWRMYSVAMDTELYTKQCNGMILGMLSRETPKRLHHAARIHTHLKYYLENGTLLFDTKAYDNHEELVAIKNGQREFDMKYAEKQVPHTIWHTRNTERLNELVLNEYKEDLR